MYYCTHGSTERGGESPSPPPLWDILLRISQKGSQKVRVWKYMYLIALVEVMVQVGGLINLIPAG